MARRVYCRSITRGARQRPLQSATAPFSGFPVRRTRPRGVVLPVDGFGIVASRVSRPGSQQNARGTHAGARTVSSLQPRARTELRRPAASVLWAETGGARASGDGACLLARAGVFPLSGDGNGPAWLGTARRGREKRGRDGPDAPGPRILAGHRSRVVKPLLPRLTG